MKPYKLAAATNPLRVRVLSPDGEMVGEFAGHLAESNATTLCDRLNQAYELGQSMGMQLQFVGDRPACGLVAGGPVPKVEGAIPQ